MCNVEEIDGRAFRIAIQTKVNGQTLLHDMYEDIRKDATAEELNVVQAFSTFIEQQITRDPRSFVDAIKLFNDSYRWSGGVPNLRTGEGKVEIHRHSEWSDFFTDPQDRTIPLDERVLMARAYLREVVLCSHTKREMWQALAVAFPRLAPILKLMESGAKSR